MKKNLQFSVLRFLEWVAAMSIWLAVFSFVGRSGHVPPGLIFTVLSLMTIAVYWALSEWGGSLGLSALISGLIALLSLVLSLLYALSR